MAGQVITPARSMEANCTSRDGTYLGGNAVYQALTTKLSTSVTVDSGCFLSQRQYSSTAPANEWTVSGGYACTFFAR